VCGQTRAVSLFREMLDSNQPMHFLFYGPPGTGKTSAVRSFCNELYGTHSRDQYILSINASYDRGIDMVRSKIKPFCKRSTTAFTREGHTIDYKLVILDEADTLTKDAQNALRRCIEIYSYNTRFCFMCNYVSNVIPPILSRCSVCHFRPVSKKDAVQFMGTVCAKEGVVCATDLMETVYDATRGDLRCCLSALQAVHNMHASITREHLDDFLQVIPDSLWVQVAAVQESAEGAQIVQKLYTSGHSICVLLGSLVRWMLTNSTDAQIYEVAPMVSRLEKQMMDCADNRLLLHEMVVTFWGAYSTA
jgi:replication factor C subunit 2/4